MSLETLPSDLPSSVSTASRDLIPEDYLNKQPIKGGLLESPVDQKWLDRVKETRQTESKHAGIAVLAAAGIELLGQPALVEIGSLSHMGGLVYGAGAGVLGVLGIGAVGYGLKLRHNAVHKVRQQAQNQYAASENVIHETLREWLVNRYQISVSEETLGKLAKQLTDCWVGNFTFRDTTNRAYWVQQEGERLIIVHGLKDTPQVARVTRAQAEASLPQTITALESSARAKIAKLGKLRLSVEAQYQLNRAVSDLGEAIETATQMNRIELLDEARTAHVVDVLNRIDTELAQMITDVSSAIYDRLLVQEQYITDRQSEGELTLDKGTSSKEADA